MSALCSHGQDVASTKAKPVDGARRRQKDDKSELVSTGQVLLSRILSLEEDKICRIQEEPFLDGSRVRLL